MAEKEAPQLSAIDLRQAGLQVGEIAEVLDRDKDEVQEELSLLLREKATTLLDEDTTEELIRLDTLLKNYWVGAVSGDKSKLRSVLDLQQRRMEILANQKKQGPRQAPGRALNEAVAEMYRRIGATHGASEESS